MLQGLKRLFRRSIEILTTRENVIIIQIYPKDRTMAVSYKKQVKTAQFESNVIKNMMKGGPEYPQNSFEVLQTAATLLNQIINHQ